MIDACDIVARNHPARASAPAASRVDGVPGRALTILVIDVGDQRA